MNRTGHPAFQIRASNFLKNTEMKPLILTAAFIILAITSQAQWSFDKLSSQQHFLYTSGELIVGKQNAGKLGLNYVYNNKLCISLGYAATAKTASSLPAEFLKSATTPTPVNSVQPFDNSENLHLMVGTIFNLAKRKSIRLVLQGGPALSNKRQANFEYAGTNKQNYVTSMENTQKISFVMNPKIELPLCCMIGCSVGPMLVINDQEKYIGAGVGLMYGIVKSK